MTETRVATLIVEIEGRQTNLDEILRRVQAEARKTQGEAEKTRRSTDGLGAGQDRAARQALSHAQSLARLAVASGDTAGAVAVLENALIGVDRASTAAIRAETQLANTKNRLARESAGARSSLAQLGQTAAGLGSALGAIGFSIGAAQILQFGQAAMASANELEKIEATLAAVAGSKERYAAVVRIAEQNQRQFGGSLADNLAPLGALLQLSNRTGASMDQLNRSAQLLRSSSPTASMGDASFSISEFLSGNGAEAAISLADRFNLPKDELAALAAAGTTAQERLAGLEAILARQGITAETLAASLNTTANTYDRLGATIGNLTTQIGGLLSQALEPAATGLGFLAEQASNAITKITGGTPPLDQFNQALVQGSSSYAEYRDAAAAAAANNGEFSASNQHLLTALNAVNPIFGTLAGQFIDSTTAVDVLTEAEYNNAVASATAAAEAANATGAAEANAGAVQLQAGTLDLSTLAAQNEAAALRDAALAAYEKAAAGADLEAQARAAALALLDAGAAGASAAERLALSSNNVDRLTAAYYRLLAAQQALAPGAGAVGALGGIGRETDSAAEATASMRVRAAAMARISNPAPTAVGGRGGRGGSGGASAAEKELERQAEAERKFQEQRLEDQQKIAEDLQAAEAEHYDRLLEIQREYEEKSLAQQRENEVDKRRSRFSFYSDLTSAEIPEDVAQGLSAAYEQAFAEAQKLAQEGKAELSAEYLALKQEQLAAELAFQEEIAEAKKNKDQAEIDRLTRLAELRRDAEQAELANLLAGGDANQADRDEALADEAERYAGDQQKIAEAAELAAARKIEATKQSTDAILAETKAMREQADLLATLNQQRIGGQGQAGANPASPTPAGGQAATGETIPLNLDPAALATLGDAAGVATAEAVAGGLADGLAAPLGAKLDSLLRAVQELTKATRDANQRRAMNPNS